MKTHISKEKLVAFGTYYKSTEVLCC